MPNDSISPAPSTRQRLDALHEHVRTLVGRDPREGLALSFEAHSLALTLGDEARLAQSEMNLGIFHWQLAQYDEAKERCRSAAERFAHLGDALGEARARGNLANVLHAQSRHAEALEQYLEVLRLAEALRDEPLRLLGIQAIGSVYEDLGEYGAALEYRLDALTLGDRLNASANRAPRLTNLGNTYVRLERYEDALGCYDAALEDARANAVPRSEMIASLGRGTTLAKLGREPQARDAFERSLRLARTLGAAPTAARALSGLIALERDPLVSDALARQADALLANLDVPAARIAVDQVYARALAEQGRRAEALERLERALSLAARHDLRDEARDAHRTASDVREALGDFEGALRHARAHHALAATLAAEQGGQRVRAALVAHRVAQAEEAVARERDINAALSVLNAENDRLLAELRFLADHDELTGLVNRRRMMRALHDAWQTAPERPFGFVLADIDHFKAVNDRHSHLVGDEVLRDVAQLLRDTLGDVGLVARFGGEEFALLLPNLGAREARAACETVRRAVEARVWSTLTPPLSVTMSFGVCSSAEHASVSDMLACADAHLYEAKRAGRNRVRG